MRTKIETEFNPYEVLGVGPKAEDDEIRAAYLARLKQYPPDRAPDDFERIRDAYDLLRDPRRRAEYSLFAVNPHVPFESLLQCIESKRPFVGLNPWLAVLKERKADGDGS